MKLNDQWQVYRCGIFRSESRHALAKKRVIDQAHSNNDNQRQMEHKLATRTAILLPSIFLTAKDNPYPGICR